MKHSKRFELNPSRLSRPQSFLAVIAFYFLALLIAATIIEFSSGSHLYLRILYADIAATLIIFAGSVLYKNASVYDPYWSVAPIIIAIYLMLFVALPETNSLRQFLVSFCILFWGFRLTYNWASQWRGMQHEDWRYRDLREKTGKSYWLVNLFGIHLFPTILVYLGCLSLVPALAVSSTEGNWLDVVAFVVAVSAVIIEATSDLQLRNFQSQNNEPEAIMRSGLWKHIRHPNYTGEMLFWWGIYLFALAANPDYWWMIIGPLAITALFFFISVPMMDKRMVNRRPAYRDHIKKTAGLIPGLKF